MSDWPIYKLVDYDDSGSLIDKCRSLLLPEDERHEPSKTDKKDNSSSGYLTSDHQSIRCPSASSLNKQNKTRNGTSKVGLLWTELIEPTSTNELDSFRLRILELCSSLQFAIR